MTSHIQELSQQLANQIAAGEVVERPASVIKELVENAIDAESTKIDIFLEEAGLKKMEVIDNGSGILPEDVLNAFKRHATSKIHTREDLFRIRSLGFRGEALPSIASVSKIVLESSTGEQAGTYLYLEGGQVVEEKANAMRKGTRVLVTDLFYNTPARLKYVKTLQTELSHISDIVNRLAMSHPNIAFSLRHDGNQLMRTTGNGDVKQTIAGIYGVETAKKMLEIEKQDLDFQIKGYVSLPELTRASRNYISLMINGRYIKNFLLTKAIVEGYGSKLMVGRFPIAVIHITMDPLLIDVNVHPTKQEVRLSKEKELMALLSETIREALVHKQLIPDVSQSQPFKKVIASKDVSEQLSLTPKQVSSSTQLETNTYDHFQKKPLAYDSQSGRFYVEELPKSTGDLASDNTNQQPISEADLESTALVDSVAVHEELSEPSISEEQRFPDLEYFGQMHGTYLFAQSSEGLYIVDQHAAQERIKYEYFREKIGEVTQDLQPLLVPIVLEYPTSDSLKLKELLSELTQVGIYLEDFGENSFIVRSHPTWYPNGQEESIIREMIDLVLKDGKISVAKFREDTAIMMSCKKSIKANHYLDDRQARQLLEDLKQCDNPFNCPHGRPVLIHFSNQDMEKMFKRIQDPH
ncbi:DNA mismatch repair endonuclease MutL [Vagococcus humatus]|uniref:DNA mismatch repair protein MutL n=1 Tax=Vagococcus humatus TaxID=1889241 RepID=A0A429Z6F0_9ENTE|nr:DNA mismatch repair endonuclease MutL [Vagococcus humatus]RST89248.1 DNA mismatch repair endonuclease MutL [Vagococcus humatus]